MSSSEPKRRILMVIAPTQFRDEELAEPKAIFEKEGWLVHVASTQLGAATGMLGATEVVATTLDEVSLPEPIAQYDAVVVVGGMGSLEYLWHQPVLHQILKTAADQNKIIGAICLSGAVLANAGVLHGKKATVWETSESLKALQVGGATYTGEACTIDGNIITANGPEAAQAFGNAIAERVKALTPA